MSELARELWPEPGRPVPIPVLAVPLRRVPPRPALSNPKPTIQLSCPACQASTQPGDRFCGQCGHSLGPAHCPQCQQETIPGARFCKFCGHSLS